MNSCFHICSFPEPRQNNRYRSINYFGGSSHQLRGCPSEGGLHFGCTSNYYACAHVATKKLLHKGKYNSIDDYCLFDTHRQLNRQLVQWFVCLLCKKFNSSFDTNHVDHVHIWCLYPFWYSIEIVLPQIFAENFWRMHPKIVSKLFNERMQLGSTITNISMYHFVSYFIQMNSSINKMSTNRSWLVY
jgi:hypothetical protein